MKKILTLLATCTLAFSVSAIDLKEGDHYEVISEQASATPEVTEFFSFYCNHCFAHEPLADKLKASAKSKGFAFNKSHVDFIRAASPEAQLNLAKAMIVAENLNKPVIIADMFKMIHVKGEKLTDLDDVKAIFVKNGVDGDKFDKSLNSFSVNIAAKKMKAEQELLEEGGYLKGVPTFIINDKYKILGKGFNATSYEEYFGQVEEAINKLVKMK